jgi:hypothetical protein
MLAIDLLSGEKERGEFVFHGRYPFLGGLLSKGYNVSGFKTGFKHCKNQPFWADF